MKDNKMKEQKEHRSRIGIQFLFLFKELKEEMAI
jgi:hypothetical protein